MTGVAAILLIVGAAVVLGALVVLHLAPTGLNPLRDPVSQYGITRFKRGYATAAWGATLGGIGGGLLITTVHGSPTVGAVLVWVFAVARFLIPFAPMDAPHQPRTSTGRLHNILAIVAFATVTAGAFLGAGDLHDAGFEAIATFSTVAAIVMAIGSAGSILGFFTAFSRLPGVFERLIYLGFIAWFGVLGIAFV
ncbi:DUF998 domain-containing protein [Herbiconiux moechotypicola]|uniref:DUF998 domain-containing protein n=1 Tax=Herbiconiux moechotypicola TaxID=637393 RepID=A0ABN3DYL4_9MICO|nr:DUF998 domain-containing protein [Herbiconiux moechotypicola]MCS5731231.1 DUF998 domain-containing protein [Herbiconiux moechotypicola]